MLYITTRDKATLYTAFNAMTKESSDNGGRFVPFRLPTYSSEEILQLKNQSYGQILADILKMFFSSRLEGWDVDFCIGRNVIRTVAMNHRIVVAELWHNLDGSFSSLEQTLYKKITEGISDNAIQNWARIVIRIGTLFGIYSDLLKGDHLKPGQTFDVSLPNDAFLTPIAAWYSRAMGLPIKKIICSCDDGGNMWDFINRGVLNTLSLSDEQQLGLERLIHATVGCDEAKRFFDACLQKKAYAVAECDLHLLNDGLFCSVAGKDRAKNTINSVFRSNSYIIDSKTALCYSGLQDYRAKTGESELTVILAENTPMRNTSTICDATGIAEDKLYNYINQS